MKQEPIVESRIKLLIASLAVLCATPILQPLIPFNIYWMPLFWAASAIPVGVLLTLSFWVGLGNPPFVGRVVLGLIGAIYAAFWGCVSTVLVQRLNSPNDVTQTPYLMVQVAQFPLLVIIFGVLFLALRPWWRLECNSELQTPSKAQFSILNLLMLTASTAVVMALVRASRSDPAALDSGMIAANVLGFGTFFFNTVCAAFAALCPTSVRRNCLFVLCISALLGVAISLASGQDRVGWWLVGGGAVISIIPTVVVLVSLLFVRSAGYRLIRKSPLVA